MLVRVLVLVELSSHLFISHHDPPPMYFAIIIRIPVALGINIELDHPPRIFPALVRLALLADSERHASDGRDRREHQKSDNHFVASVFYATGI